MSCEIGLSVTEYKNGKPVTVYNADDKVFNEYFSLICNKCKNKIDLFRSTTGEENESYKGYCRNCYSEFVFFIK